MALSRRLFLRGILTAAAAPAIVQAQNIMPIVPCRGGNKFLTTLDELAWYTPAGTVTGRLTAEEPAWQEFKKADDLYLPHQREAIKRMLFCQRYGTPSPMIRGPREKRLIMTDLDYSRLEARAMALYIKPMG